MLVINGLKSNENTKKVIFRVGTVFELIVNTRTDEPK